jgi:hypothetical protein
MTLFAKAAIGLGVLASTVFGEELHVRRRGQHVSTRRAQRLKQFLYFTENCTGVVGVGDGKKKK